jgi:inhibitor of cysteine peptidase
MHNTVVGAWCSRAGQQRTWRRWLLMFVPPMSLLLLLLLLNSCTTSTSLTNADNGKTIQVHVGNELAIALDANPSTGYQWAIEKRNDLLLPLKQSSFSASNGSIGSSGTQTFTWVAKRAGTVHLQFKYWRSFEGDRSITRQFAVTIEIQG